MFKKKPELCYLTVFWLKIGEVTQISLIFGFRKVWRHERLLERRRGKRTITFVLAVEFFVEFFIALTSRGLLMVTVAMKGKTSTLVFCCDGCCSCGSESLGAKCMLLFF